MVINENTKGPCGPQLVLTHVVSITANVKSLVTLASSPAVILAIFLAFFFSCLFLLASSFFFADSILVRSMPDYKETGVLWRQQINIISVLKWHHCVWSHKWWALLVWRLSIYWILPKQCLRLVSLLEIARKLNMFRDEPWSINLLREMSCCLLWPSGSFSVQKFNLMFSLQMWNNKMENKSIIMLQEVWWTAARKKKVR